MECKFYLRKFQSEFGTTQREMQGKQLNFFLTELFYEPKRETKTERESMPVNRLWMESKQLRVAISSSTFSCNLFGIGDGTHSGTNLWERRTNNNKNNK